MSNIELICKTFHYTILIEQSFLHFFFLLQVFKWYVVCIRKTVNDPCVFHFNWYGAIFVGKKHIFSVLLAFSITFINMFCNFWDINRLIASSFGLPIFALIKCCNWLKGERVLQDFNIQNEAGGSKRALIKTFEANVTNTIMEIHFFWAGKGTCCIPFQGTYGPLVSAVHVYQGFFFSSCNFWQFAFSFRQLI